MREREREEREVERKGVRFGLQALLVRSLGSRGWEQGSNSVRVTKQTLHQDTSWVFTMRAAVAEENVFHASRRVLRMQQLE